PARVRRATRQDPRESRGRDAGGRRLCCWSGGRRRGRCPVPARAARRRARRRRRALDPGHHAPSRRSRRLVLREARKSMPKPPWMLWIGAGGLAAGNPTMADYCAPGTPQGTAADGGSRDAASDGGTEGGRDASACDPTRSPHDDGCVIDAAYGVFVSPAGSDSNQGTKSAPLRTIGRGMDVAKLAGKRVYVCAGTFPAKLVVAAARDGVNVYGALD